MFWTWHHAVFLNLLSSVPNNDQKETSQLWRQLPLHVSHLSCCRHLWEYKYIASQIAVHYMNTINTHLLLPHSSLPLQLGPSCNKTHSLPEYLGGQQPAGIKMFLIKSKVITQRFFFFFFFFAALWNSYAASVPQIIFPSSLSARNLDCTAVLMCLLNLISWRCLTFMSVDTMIQQFVECRCVSN